MHDPPLTIKERRKKRRRSVNWNGFIVTLSLLLIVTVVASSTVADGLSKMQPSLRALAQTQPQETVAVIVQQGGDAAAAALVPQLGGRVTKDLSIIDAFVAEMPAGRVADLARAGGVRWVSLDTPVERAATPALSSDGGPAECGYDSLTQTTGPNCFPGTLNLQAIRNMGLDGSGIGVAIIDSGISPDLDFSDLGRTVSFNPYSTSNRDVNGHGTHVAGIVAGNGRNSGGLYQGLAPGVTLIALKISDETGMAYVSDTVAAMQWVLENRQSHNIRVVNLSINSSMEMSYHESPLDAAAEILWFNGIVVVASAGNRDANNGYNTIDAAPANDPFVITVGASHEHNSYEWADDTVASYTAFGMSVDGFQKPEIIAPGQDVTSVLSKHSSWDDLYPERAVRNDEYFRISGTSMAAPMVSGAVALILQHEPWLTPDQVKYRLLEASTRALEWTADENGSPVTYSVPYLDLYAAVTAGTTATANTGTAASRLLWSGVDPVTWGSVNWASVNWASVNWASVNWASVNWASVNWASVTWEP